MDRHSRFDPSAVLKVLVGAALFACAPGCSLFGGGRQPATLASNDPGSKIPAIKQAVAAKDTQTAEQLVKALESNDPAVRFYAIRGLQNLTGETFGYVWYTEDETVRQESVDKWKQWLDANAGSLAGGDTTPATNGK